MPRLESWVARVVHYPPGATWGPRTLDDFEFVWLLQGEATWYWAGVCHQLQPGDLLLARPGMHDMFVWDPERPTRHAFVHFQLDDALPQLGPTGTWPLVRHMDEPIDSLCRYMLHLGGAGPEHVADAQQQAEKVLSLLVIVFVRGPVATPGALENSLPEHVRRVADYVRQTWSSSGLRPISLAEMANAAAISRRTLCRTFRARFGLGPVACLERIRLAHAAEMLIRSNMSIRAISDSCGYVNPYHFSRKFGNIYRVSPRGYRRHTPSTDPLLAANLVVLANQLQEAGR